MHPGPFEPPIPGSRRQVYREIRSRGFTLIELLAVILVVAVLAALVLPAVARAKPKARELQCKLHIGQWGRLFLSYAQDNEEESPRESSLSNGVTINTWGDVQLARSLDVWYNALPTEGNIRPARDYAPQAMRDQFYSGNLFHCPAARFPRDAGRDSVAYFSLAMNSRLILEPHDTVKISSILSPTDTVLFLENRLPQEHAIDPWQYSFALGQPSAYATRVVARHQGRVNLAFADGSTRAIAGSSIVTNGMAHFPQTPVIWTADPTRNPNDVTLFLSSP